MFSRLTPLASMTSTDPSTRGLMTLSFHLTALRGGRQLVSTTEQRGTYRACTMRILSGEPSKRSPESARPLTVESCKPATIAGVCSAFLW